MWFINWLTISLILLSCRSISMSCGTSKNMSLWKLLISLLLRSSFFNLSKKMGFIFLWFLTNFFCLSSLIVLLSLELTRVNPDRNIFSINVELTSTFFYSTEVCSITITEFKNLMWSCLAVLRLIPKGFRF